LALQQLHDDKRLAIVIPDIVKGANIGMVEDGYGPGLSSEARHRSAGCRQLHGQEFEDNVTTQADVFGPVHLSHATLANLLNDPVMGNRFANHFAVDGRRKWSG
jgi:hypothetical protein